MSEEYREALIAEKIRAMRPAEVRVADSVDHIVQWLAKDLDRVTALIDRAPSLGGTAVVINKEHMTRALQDTRERLSYWLRQVSREIRENLIQRPDDAVDPPDARVDSAELQRITRERDALLEFCRPCDIEQAHASLEVNGNSRS